jgi:hypothetical protein
MKRDLSAIPINKGVDMSDWFRSALKVDRVGSRVGIALIGFVVAVIALLANKPGLAIIVASLVIPAVLLTELPHRDAFEDEPWWGSLAVLGWGILTGIVVSAIASAIAAEWWIDGAALHVGAAGFGGAAADAEGTPGFGVLLLNGILLPPIAIALGAIGAYAMRRYPVFRNETMDGVTLGVAGGCGLATGSTIVFVWPMISGGGANGGSVADWTALLLGVLVTRPIIFGLTVSFLCAGIWHVALSLRSVDLVFPAAIGLGGAVVFAFGDLLVQPSGTRPELLWQVIVAAGLAVAARVVLTRSLAQDNAGLAVVGSRVVCPNCGVSTPAGLYCASCGAVLGEPARASEETSPNSSNVSTPNVEVSESTAHNATPQPEIT